MNLISYQLSLLSWAGSISTSNSQAGSQEKLGQGHPKGQSPTVTQGHVRIHCKWVAVQASRQLLSNGSRQGSRQIWRRLLQLSSQSSPASNDASGHLRKKRKVKSSLVLVNTWNLRLIEINTLTNNHWSQIKCKNHFYPDWNFSMDVYLERLLKYRLILWIQCYFNILFHFCIFIIVILVL